MQKGASLWVCCLNQGESRHRNSGIPQLRDEPGSKFGIRPSGEEIFNRSGFDVFLDCGPVQLEAAGRQLNSFSML